MIGSPRQLEGSAAMWAVTFHCLPSTLTSNDEHVLTFDWGDVARQVGGVYRELVRPPSLRSG